MRLWYLRRAAPWATLLGCLLAGAAITGLTHRWDSFTGPGLQLVALLAAIATAFLFDEPAVAVTAVTPRGTRWATSARLGAAVLTLAAGLALVVAVPAEVSEMDWALVLVALCTAVVLLALLGSRRHQPRPGSPIAAAVALLGMAPMILVMLFDLRSPYPLPDLSDGLRAFWGATAGIGVTYLAAGSLRPRRRRPRRPARPGLER